MLTVSLGVANYEQLAAAWRELVDRHPEKVQIAITKIRTILLSSIQMNFREQVSPEGKPWTPSLRAKMGGGMTLSSHGASGLKGSINVSNTEITMQGRYAFALHIFTRNPFAHVHQQQEGSTGFKIRPRKGKYLTIPFPGAFSASELQRRPRMADFMGRTWTDFQTGSGSPIVFWLKPKGTKGHVVLKPIFILRTMVEIPPRPFMGARKTDFPLMLEAITSTWTTEPTAGS